MLDNGNLRQEDLVKPAVKANNSSENQQVALFYPPASSALDSYTVQKFYQLSAEAVQGVLDGQSTDVVDFPMKPSPTEWRIIMEAPSPPSSILLLGRSGTGKTTCLLYRMWFAWKAGLHLQEAVQQVFITASATLRSQVQRAFLKLQRAVLQEGDYEARVEALEGLALTKFDGIPPAAFPLFLTSVEYLRMLDGSLPVGA